MADCRAPFAVTTSASTTLDFVERLFGGVARLYFGAEFFNQHPPLKVDATKFAGSTALDINGHTALTLNAVDSANWVVDVNTGGGTLVGQPWSLSGPLPWLNWPVIYPAAGLII